MFNALPCACAFVTGMHVCDFTGVGGIVSELQSLRCYLRRAARRSLHICHAVCVSSPATADVAPGDAPAPTDEDARHCRRPEMDDALAGETRNGAWSTIVVAPAT